MTDAKRAIEVLSDKFNYDKVKNIPVPVIKLSYEAGKGLAELIESLSAEREAAKREADAAKYDMNFAAYNSCLACKYQDGELKVGVSRKGTPCWDCSQHSLKFEWRGLCAENGGYEGRKELI